MQWDAAETEALSLSWGADLVQIWCRFAANWAELAQIGQCGAQKRRH